MKHSSSFPNGFAIPNPTNVIQTATAGDLTVIPAVVNFQEIWKSKSDVQHSSVSLLLGYRTNVCSNLVWAPCVFLYIWPSINHCLHNNLCFQCDITIVSVIKRIWAQSVACSSVYASTCIKVGTCNILIATCYNNNVTFTFSTRRPSSLCWSSLLTRSYRWGALSCGRLVTLCLLHFSYRMSSGTIVNGTAKPCSPML